MFALKSLFIIIKSFLEEKQKCKKKMLKLLKLSWYIVTLICQSFEFLTYILKDPLFLNILLDDKLLPALVFLV